jgi:hypothetical protein
MRQSWRYTAVTLCRFIDLRGYFVVIAGYIPHEIGETSSGAALRRARMSGAVHPAESRSDALVDGLHRVHWLAADELAQDWGRGGGPAGTELGVKG